MDAVIDIRNTTQVGGHGDARDGRLLLLSGFPVRLVRLVRAAACLTGLGLLPAGVRHGIVVCLVLLLGSMCMGDAQAAAVCSNTPGTGDWILCTEGSTSTDDIDIDVDGVAISTTNNSDRGIKAEHAGGTAATQTDPAVPADITIDVTGTATKNTISTSGSTAEGIFGKHTGIGDVDIDVTGVRISTAGTASRGVYGEHTGTGNIDIGIEGATTGRTISTAGMGSDGVFGKHTGFGDVHIDLEDIAITTTSGTTSSAEGVRVEHTGTGDVDIDATGVSLSTMGSDSSASDGVYVRHSGGGNIDISIEGTAAKPSTVTTTARLSYGIYAQKFSTTIEGTSFPKQTSGNIAITLGNTRIDTSGEVPAVYAQKQRWNSGLLTATLNSGVTITTQGDRASGVYLQHQNEEILALDNDVTLTGNGTTTVTTTGDRSHGLRAVRSSGRGDVTIDVDRITITTEGDSAYGIYGDHSGDGNDGDVTIDATNGSITTGSSVTEGGTTTLKGRTAHGIRATHRDTSSPKNRTAVGDIRITTRNFKINTTSTADFRPPDYFGPYAYGIFASHENSGNIVIDLGQGSSVTTEGQNSHGVVASHSGTAATRTIDITLGGPVSAKGADASGVRVGTAALDEEGYRQQTVTVNSSISSQGEGIYLVRGGRVIIGPGGSIRSGSGIAILATGTVPEDASDPNNVIPAIPPKLRVDLNLGGRRVSQAIDDDWILNDGGETTIAVNGVVLHDGATGVTEETARNGAWNVRMEAGGVKVTDRTNADPAMWVVSDRAEGVIAGRDFSAADFSEIRRFVPPPPPPPPPPEPDPPAVDAVALGQLVGGAIANALGSLVPAPSGQPKAQHSFLPSIVEEYAPRAAVYEALPAALLGLNEAGQGTGAPPPQGSFTFARTLAGRGGGSPAGSTVGQSHGFGYRGVQSGVSMELGETLRASAALHRVRSRVGVEAGTGGGVIGVEATGFVLDGAWQGPDGLYAKAGLSMTHYDIGASSEDRAVGMLTGGVEASGSLVRVEAGRRVALAGGPDVAPRIWVGRSALSVDDFTDAVGSRVSVSDTARLAGGVGMTVRGERRAGAGMLVLEGSGDLAHALDGTTSVTDVSGARLTSEAEEMELRLALAGVWRQGGFSLAAQASMNASDSGDARDAVGVRLSAQF